MSNHATPAERDDAMADARDQWLAKRAAKAAEDARLLALRQAASKRSVVIKNTGK